MSLTKEDLQQIREIVHDEITTEVPPMIEAAVFPLRSDIKIIKEKLEQIWKSESEDITATTELIEKLQKELFDLKSRVKSLELARSK